MQIILATKRNDVCDLAVKYAQQYEYNGLGQVTVVNERRLESLDWMRDADPHYLICFLYHWIVPAAILNNVKVAAINFHPAPPEYRGAGSYSYAIYNREQAYGTTCHHMDPVPDSGAIIKVRRFGISEAGSFELLKQLTMVQTLVNFCEIIDVIRAGGPLPMSNERWSGPVRRQREFRDFLTITPAMDSVEINRRINCANPAYAGPWINLAGQRYTLRNDASYQMFDYGLLANAPREAGAVAPSLHADVGTANRKETER